jgi:hypothetical protein
MEDEKQAPPCAPDAALVGYTFVRHVGFILDELSSQGLDLWRDERQRWRWRWLGTGLRAGRGFWAIGEALVDAVVTRWPGVFDAEGSDATRNK